MSTSSSSFDSYCSSDWYSPTRLHSDPNIQYDFPGDRFIPNRSLMNLEKAHSLLTNKPTKKAPDSKFNEVYHLKLEENLTLDSEGRPFQMLVFRGSPKSRRKSVRHIDEMKQAEAEADALSSSTKQHRYHCLPKRESRILDAPKVRDDFYMNIMDWGKNNTLAVALDSEVYMWNADNRNVTKLLEAHGLDDFPTSIGWSEDGKTIAVGYVSSKLELWDAEKCKITRSLGGHTNRVGTTAWNGNILTSGGHDKCIINHDVRARDDVTSCLQVHNEEVCGLKWSNEGKVLASGGNDNLIYIWQACRMSSSNYLYQFKDHRAAVRALAWCPFQSDVLASGGGTQDGYIKIWNTQRGTCINSINTNAQICGLEWNQHHKEILSGHGYSMSEQGNRLCLWRYPSMKKGGEWLRHSSRVLHLTQSPDGLTVGSAGADETLRLWDMFGPPANDNSTSSELDGYLSLKTFPLR